MRERMVKKNRIRSRAVALLSVFVFLFSFVGCKKEPEKVEESATPSPTPVVTTKGFADANEALVKQRAEANAATVAVALGDLEISMQKAMFLIYSMEVQGNSYAVFYENQYGLDYWNMELDEDGRTTRDMFKEETIAALIQYAVMEDCAIKSGMGLTTEENLENNAFVEELKWSLTAEETERGGFTTENLREVCAWMKLGEKYYSKMTDSLGITKESVRETVNKEDYKEYETEYLYLPLTYYDEAYNICEESEDVKTSRRAQMQDCYEQVVAGVSFEELVSTDESLVHNTRTFLANGAEAEAAYMEAAVKLKVGDVCAPVETEYGVYLIRMLDDECTKTYEATVEAEYELQRSEAFEAAYEVLLAEYDVQVNEEAWAEIVLGATVSLLE